MKKDLNWLVQRIHSEREQLEQSGFEGKETDDESVFNDGRDEALSNVLRLIDQLDEPEVLSQEWIDENKSLINGRSTNPDGTEGDCYDAHYIHVLELQNLLVPKQELPVIPNYVAKWISVHHEQFDLYPALKRLESNALSWEDVYEWYRRNTHTFVKAYLTGRYEVEKEQKYYVLDTEDIPMLVKSYGAVNRANTHLSIHEKGRNTEHYQLTEQEIKDYDPRYMTFAVKVEEMGE